MDKEERNRVMDVVFQVDQKLQPESLLWSEERRRAIRECNRLARAWDHVYELMKTEKNTECAKWHQMIMEDALNPPPQDPLEELEEFVYCRKRNVHNQLGPGHATMQLDEVLAEIRRLREKGKK